MTKTKLAKERWMLERQMRKAATCADIELLDQEMRERKLLLSGISELAGLFDIGRQSDDEPQFDSPVSTG